MLNNDDFQCLCSSYIFSIAYTAVVKSSFVHGKQNHYFVLIYSIIIKMFNYDHFNIFPFQEYKLIFPVISDR